MESWGASDLLGALVVVGASVVVGAFDVVGASVVVGAFDVVGVPGIGKTGFRIKTRGGIVPGVRCGSVGIGDCRPIENIGVMVFIFISGGGCRPRTGVVREASRLLSCCSLLFVSVWI